MLCTVVVPGRTYADELLGLSGQVLVLFQVFQMDRKVGGDLVHDLRHVLDDVGEGRVRRCVAVLVLKEIVRELLPLVEGSAR